VSHPGPKTFFDKEEQEFLKRTRQLTSHGRRILVDSKVALASTHKITCYVPAVLAQLTMAQHYWEKEFFHRRALWKMQREHFFLCMHEIKANAASGKGTREKGTRETQQTGEHHFLEWFYCRSWSALGVDVSLL
jgi:hypothetical protein